MLTRDPGKWLPVSGQDHAEKKRDPGKWPPVSGPSRQGHPIDDLFAPWASAKHILAAVSGGPDSMALLSMLAQWTSANDRRPALSAATVDHRLRPEAAQEAEAVAAFALSLADTGAHINHSTLTWRHDEPQTRLQERARQARYELLAAHAAEIGADVLMTAHHADDQAETILFRLVRGSGPAGLAGMARERLIDGLRLARPLLAMRKDELVGWCRERDIGWSEDPSNTNSRFARTRMRALLPDLEREGMGPGEWARLAARAARGEEALNAVARSTADLMIGRETDGALSLDLGKLLEQPEEIALRVLIIAVESFRPGQPVRLERAEALLRRLVLAHGAELAKRTTLGQAGIALSPKGMLTLQRQAERRRGRARN
ncbi:MAG: tRNA lysidine(34) synthetase TilS [Hyphomicrobiales bacterium]|nr:tRNA lysidine(34) synthetase TilS [Hyphomicrobiales bacterium]